MEPINRWGWIAPLINLSSYFLFILLIELEYNAKVLSLGIDPKDAGYDLLQSIINISMLLSFIGAGYFILIIFYGIIKRKKINYFYFLVLYFIIFILMIVNIEYNPTMFWYFD